MRKSTSTVKRIKSGYEIEIFKEDSKQSSFLYKFQMGVSDAKLLAESIFDNLGIKKTKAKKEKRSNGWFCSHATP